MPNPIAYYMHGCPWWFHSFEVLVNHFVELIVPFFLLMGRRMCAIHGILQILFQVGLDFVFIQFLIDISTKIFRKIKTLKMEDALCT